VDDRAAHGAGGVVGTVRGVVEVRGVVLGMTEVGEA
jgi:hypothetical protein